MSSEFMPETKYTKDIIDLFFQKFEIIDGKPFYTRHESNRLSVRGKALPADGKRYRWSYLNEWYEVKVLVFVKHNGGLPIGPIRFKNKNTLDVSPKNLSARVDKESDFGEVLYQKEQKIIALENELEKLLSNSPNELVRLTEKYNLLKENFDLVDETNARYLKELKCYREKFGELDPEEIEASASKRSEAFKERMKRYEQNK